MNHLLKYITVATLLVLFFTVPLGKLIVNQLIIWDVGQGQWVTHIRDNKCYHFDMGGEKAPWTEIFKNCAQKKNYVSFSHWDLDHINFAGKAQYYLKNICILHMPGGPINQKKFRRYLKNIPLCRSKNNQIKEIKYIKNENYKKLSSNSESRIFTLKDKILISGDSTKKEEKLWAPHIINNRISFFVLGHHGSQYSNSPKLLRHLNHLKMSFASCRKKRYGHPHQNTINRIKRTGAPVITTEIWGNIYLNL
jgi:competence protein ComEC